jgi:hypothetical protein
MKQGEQLRSGEPNVKDAESATVLADRAFIDPWPMLA